MNVLYNLRSRKNTLSVEKHEQLLSVLIDRLMPKFGLHIGIILVQLQLLPAI